MNDTAAASAISTSMILFIALGIYILMAFPLYTMGKKTGSTNAWFAFVPILNTILMLEIAGKELWWFILLLIPCVNIVVFVIVWMGIAEAMDKPGWLGVLMLVPVANIIVPFYLAFG
jgi:hypothetical protein